MIQFSCDLNFADLTQLVTNERKYFHEILDTDCPIHYIAS